MSPEERSMARRFVKGVDFRQPNESVPKVSNLNFSTKPGERNISNAILKFIAAISHKSDGEILGYPVLLELNKVSLIP
jgi:hypothetical protein